MYFKIFNDEMALDARYVNFLKRRSYCECNGGVECECSEPTFEEYQLILLKELEEEALDYFSNFTDDDYREYVS